MEIHKMKILLYAITFLGYAWNGYGSGLLTNLRDAVFAAEDFFGNFLENTIDIFKKLSEAYRVLDASGENCKFSCPAGGTPVQNKIYKPSSNGCGTDLLKLKISEYIPSLDMTDCCNSHDMCYDTCNNKKEYCDNEFKNCLYDLCSKASKIESLVKACKVAASMVGGSMTLGCKSYLESQKKSCYCPADKKKYKYTAGGEI